MCNWIFCYHGDPVFLSFVLCWTNCFSPLQKVPLKATLTFFLIHRSFGVWPAWVFFFFFFISYNENISVPNVTMILFFSRTAPADLSKIIPEKKTEARLENSIGTLFTDCREWSFFHVQVFMNTQHLYFYPQNDQERSAGSLPWKCFASCNFCAFYWNEIKCMTYVQNNFYGLNL